MLLVTPSKAAPCTQQFEQSQHLHLHFSRSATSMKQLNIYLPTLQSSLLSRGAFYARYKRVKTGGGGVIKRK